MEENGGKKRNMKRVLVVDDEENMCLVLKMTLEKDGCTVITAHNGEEAIDLLNDNNIFDLIISDLRMPGIGGLGILKYLKQNKKGIPIVFITAYGSIETAVNAMKMGAFDFITKPFNRDVIRHTVRSIFKMEKLKNENILLRQSFNESELIYQSQAIKQIMKMVKKIANVPTPVLITGESGTGKNLIATKIHNLIDDERPFVRINCPSVPPTLFESELFGFQKGAFTGATRDFKGKLRLADGGTLFLDEIADLPLEIQPKLLRVLEDSSFEPLGSNSTVIITTRFICATNHNLEELVEKGLFRKDLYYRINTITINIPPLRERPDDIIPLAEYFLNKYSRDFGKTVEGISSEVKKIFLKYSWPGNIRELKNLIERAVVLSSKRIISLSDILLNLNNKGTKEIIDTGNAQDKLASMEKKFLIEILNECNWNISKTARKLGITRSTLRYRINKYRLHSG